MLWKLLESRVPECLHILLSNMFVTDVFNEGIIFAVSALTISTSSPGGDGAPVCLSSTAMAAACLSVSLHCFSPHYLPALYAYIAFALLYSCRLVD